MPHRQPQCLSAICGRERCIGRQWNIDGIDLVSCSEVVCRLPEKTEAMHMVERRVYVEADGELLGRLPARMTMQPDALSLVVPA